MGEWNGQGRLVLVVVVVVMVDECFYLDVRWKEESQHVVHDFCSCECTATYSK